MPQLEQPSRRIEKTALGILIALFLFGIYRCELLEQRLDTQAQPSTLAATRSGAGAVYALFQSLGYTVGRQTTPWTQIDGDPGLLVALEPFSRQPTLAENSPLRQWIERGGTLLFACAGSPEPADSTDTIAGDVALVPAKSTLTHIPPRDAADPYVNGVKSISVSSRLRIAPMSSAHYDVLFQDDQGVVAVHKRLGHGNVLLMANDLIATNAGISQDDNAVFLVNVATAASRGSDRRVVFDEYHHGVGFESDAASGITTIWRNLPGPLRWTMLVLAVFSMILVFTVNTRQVPTLEAVSPPSKSSGSYVQSMGRMYYRTGAARVAIGTLFSRLMQDIRRELNLEPGHPPSQVLSSFSDAYPSGGAILREVIRRSEQVMAGSTLPDSELIALAEAIDKFRRDYGIAGFK